MIPQLEQPIEYLQAELGYSPKSAMVLLAEYFKQRANGATPNEAEAIFFDYIESKATQSETIFREVRLFHKRLCSKGFRPEQVADVVDAFYNKE